MSDEAVIDRGSLSDVMLAMDVVDTLRHRRLLVERELKSEQRDQELLKRLREIYQSQGMEVTDEVLRAGVQALREERFSYQPPSASLQVRLARIYVQRGKWGLRAAVVLVLLLLCWFGYTYFVTWPAAELLQKQVAALNDEVGAAADRIQLLMQEKQALVATIDGYTDDVAQEYRELAAAKLGSARNALAQADTLADSASALNQPADFSRQNIADRSRPARERLRRQQELIMELEQAIKQARNAIADFDSLRILPAQYAQLREAIASGAREKRASELANLYFDSGISALAAGDIGEAEKAVGELRTLHARLLQSYTLLVVSREGEQSGVWRVPDRNPNARNYYLIVEAIDSDGKPVVLTVTNEENGSRAETGKWGLRVSERAYRRVAADKADDGIIQGRRVGEKRRGYLDPEYLVDSDGGAITQW